MNDLISRCKGEEKKSLATFKPSEIIKFHIEPDEREWKKEWLEQLRQFNLFDLDESGQGKVRRVIPKLPYKYSYEFVSEGDRTPRKLMIEDWELGALYWKIFRKSGGNEAEANRQVRAKYFETFTNKNDVYFFLGTTQQYHLVSPNPFIIVGVFYPLKKDVEQPILF